MLPRALQPALEAALADTPVVLLHGARQTGKTTLARSIDPKRRRYITLDDGAALAAAASDPDAFIAGLDGPVVIDEVQRAPGLFRAIKATVDRDRAPGRFLLTGSANVLALPRASESLAGRMQILTLWPMSQGELDGRRERFIDSLFDPDKPAAAALAATTSSAATTVLDRILRGGFPEAASRDNPDRRAAWFESYVSTILQRDVRDLANIESLTAMPALLGVLAARSSGLLNSADLSRSLSIPATTLKRYLALLEAVFLFVPLPAWTGNIGLRAAKAPKAMLGDTGLAASLLGADQGRLTADPALLGSLLESFVAMELRKQAGWSRTRVRLHHFRTHSGREVDIVLEATDGRIAGVEVKAGRAVSPDDFAGLRTLAETAGRKFRAGIILYGGSETVQFGPGLLAAPHSALWQGNKVPTSSR
jgi:predicted AAA+ superfamily ATPase